MKTKTSNKNFLIFLFSFALIIRLLVFSFYLLKNENYWQIDSRAYHEIALQIAKGNGISKEDGNPNFHRLPLYPIFISSIYFVFGPKKEVALALQIFIASLIPLLIFALSLTLFPLAPLTAKAAGLVGCIHIGFVLYSGFFMTESLFIFLFLAFCILFFKNLKKEDNNLKILIPGILLGLASLTRPVGQFLILASIFIIFISGLKIKPKICKSLFLFLGWLAIVSTWLVRNYLLLGHIFFHTLPGGHFLNLSAARVAMHIHECSYEKAREILAEKLKGEFKEAENIKNEKLSPIEECYISERLALEYFKKEPFISLKYWILDIFRTSFSLYSAEVLYIESLRVQINYFQKGRTVLSMIKRYIFPETDLIWLRLLIIFEILFFAFLLLGFLAQSLRELFNRILRGTSDEWQSFRNSLIFIAIFLSISLAGGYARMRLPAEAFLIIISLLFWNRFAKSYVYKTK